MIHDSLHTNSVSVIIVFIVTVTTDKPNMKQIFLSVFLLEKVLSEYSLVERGRKYAEDGREPAIIYR